MKNFIIKNQHCLITVTLIALFMIMSLYTIDTYARAGGGGGSSGGSGGDGGGLIGILIYIIFMIPFPWNFVVIGLIILLGWWGNKKNKQQTVLNQLPMANMMDKQKVITNYMQQNPTFDVETFKAKVKQAFIQIQEAWMLKDMGKVRKYISDGMYQRLNIQFKMMNILDQKNIIENLLVKNIIIDKIEYDGRFDIIHAAIHASIVDKFISSKYPQLNSGGTEEFVEYWSFIKKRGIKEANLFDSQNCPKCGAELPKNAGDVSQCSYCKTITNLGDYDWILSEMTQADDYIGVHPKASKESALAIKVNELVKSDEDFSIQNIEDKASNGYLQIITANTLKDSTIMRRFVSDELYERLSHFNEDNIVYNRIYLNDVTLIGASQSDNKNILSIAIKSSYQRVMLKDGKATLLDSMVLSKTETVLMSRDVNHGLSKGSLYAHSCPSCGGPVKDTIDTKCQYCEAELNSTKNEWIITDILGVSEYRNYYQENKDDFVASIGIDKIESLYDVRDYAFNNVLVVMAANGKFELQELDMAQKLAKKWGYKVDRIQPMFDMAKNGSLIIRMPEDQKKRQKIFKLMEKAAAIDGMVSAEEKQLLENVKQQYIQAA
ncbi:MAG: TIM44-like domain-containing protein [Bacteroidales bacterium]